MLYIPVILGSTRRGRQSSKVAKFVYDRLRRTGGREISPSERGARIEGPRRR